MSQVDLRSVIQRFTCNHVCPSARSTLLLMASFWVAACGTSAPDAGVVRPETSLQSALGAEAELRRAIEVEVGAAACADSTQCKALALGALACGGPEGWLAWAPSSTRPKEVQKMAARLEAMARERNRRFGLASVCTVQPEPQAICQLGRCVLRPGHGRD